jgi:hypothetical protein
MLFYLFKQRLVTCIPHKAVIPADTLRGTRAGIFTFASNIQRLSGCRLKSGTTNYLIAGVIE